MPNYDSLQTLMNLQSPSNYSAGARPAYTPNVGRNAARVGALRRVFGLEGPDTGDISQTDLESAYGDVQADQRSQLEAEAQAKAFPYEVQGRYNVERERVRAAAQAQEAQRREAVARESLGQRQAFTANENSMNRDAIAGRQTGSQAAMATRQAAAQRAIDMRAQAGRNAAQAQDIRRGKVQAPGASFPYGLLGMGKSQKQADEALLQSLAPQTSVGGDEMAVLAQDYRQYAGLNDDDLLGLIEESQPDASNEEMLALFHAIRSAR